MQHRKDSAGHWIVLEKGEDVFSSIAQCAAAEGITGAQIWGIGALQEVELGYFETGRRAYAHRRFPGVFELLSFSGNLNSQGIHAHVVLSGHGGPMSDPFATFGGHLFSAKIGLAGEFFLVPTGALPKSTDEATGLSQIQLGPASERKNI